MSELNDTLTIRQDNKDYTITMYAGILSKISEATNGIDGLDLISYDTETQMKLVECVVKKYDDSGNEEGFVISPFKLTSDNFSKILYWGLEHYTVFMINSSKRAVEIMNKLKNSVENESQNLTHI